jgi:hypothetical protein
MLANIEFTLLRCNPYARLRGRNPPVIRELRHRSSATQVRILPAILADQTPNAPRTTG